MSEESGKKLVFVSDLTHTGQTIALNTVPFAAASLISYAKANLASARYQFRLFKYPEKLVEAVLGAPPDIICFSNYVWNLDLNYGMAERIKRRNPKAIVIFGGPN